MANGGIIGPINTVANGCTACATAPGNWQVNTVYDFVKSNDWVYNFADLEYLVVAGGGAGGRNYGAGGGAGGYRTASGLALRNGTVAVTIGAGGTQSHRVDR